MPEGPWIAGIDVGGTGVRLALAPAATPVLTTTRSVELAVPGRVTAAGRDADGVLAAALPALAELLRQVPGGQLAAVAVGAAGMALLGAELAAKLPGPLAAATGARRLALAGDAVTAHIGALGTRSGVTVAGGTGLVALGVHPERGWHRADGWGQLLGDCGSGAWIGRAGLEAALRAHDGRPGGSPALLAAARTRFGPPEGLPAALTGRPDRAALLAGFAPDVAGAAGAGDPVAAAVLEGAAEEIAATAAAAAAGLDSPRVALTGGLFRLPGLPEAVHDRLPSHRRHTPDGPPLLGALRLAAACAGPAPLPWPPAPPLLTVLEV
ncbi:BadF/BadG/BcrA/BcrD ATPase family protein [Streptomyces sp. NPDC089919]|uniref:BadF/BadG/BcrA/BcrD ATPase family protein n=1 Tax=Streptomyces sp. NPDC089919 TaxID=3155188 RepID=UPI003439E11A